VLRSNVRLLTNGSERRKARGRQKKSGDRKREQGRTKGKAKGGTSRQTKEEKGSRFRVFKMIRSTKNIQQKQADDNRLKEEVSRQIAQRKANGKLIREVAFQDQCGVQGKDELPTYLRTSNVGTTCSTTIVSRFKLEANSHYDTGYK